MDEVLTPPKVTNSRSNFEVQVLDIEDEDTPFNRHPSDINQKSNPRDVLKSNESTSPAQETISDPIQNQGEPRNSRFFSMKSYICSLLILVVLLVITWKKIIRGKRPRLLPPDNFHVYLIPHSHMDTDWLETEDDYYMTFAKDIITSVISGLEADDDQGRDRRFIFNELNYLKKYLIQFPEKAMRLKRLVDMGKLEITTGGVVSPDTACIAIDDIIMNFDLGREFLTRYLNISTKNLVHGWMVDQFGMSSGMLSVMSQMGFKSISISRMRMDVESKLKKDSAFLSDWKTRNGNIMMNKLPESYTNDPPFDLTPSEIQEKINITLSILSPKFDLDQLVLEYLSNITYFRSRYSLPLILIPIGNDFAFKNYSNDIEAFEMLILFVRSNNVTGVFPRNFTIRQSTLSEYFEAINSYIKIYTDGSAELPAKDYNLMPLVTPQTNPNKSSLAVKSWTGFFNTKPREKYMMRRFAEQARSLRSFAAYHILSSDIDLTKSLILDEGLTDYPKKDIFEGVLYEAALLTHHDTITCTSYNEVTTMRLRQMERAFLKVSRHIAQFMNKILELPANSSQLYSLATNYEELQKLTPETNPNFILVGQSTCENYYLKYITHPSTNVSLSCKQISPNSPNGSSAIPAEYVSYMKSVCKPEEMIIHKLRVPLCLDKLLLCTLDQIEIPSVVVTAEEENKKRLEFLKSIDMEYRVVDLSSVLPRTNLTIKRQGISIESPRYSVELSFIALLYYYEFPTTATPGKYIHSYDSEVTLEIRMDSIEVTDMEKSTCIYFFDSDRILSVNLCVHKKSMGKRNREGESSHMESGREEFMAISDSFHLDIVAFNNSRIAWSDISQSKSAAISLRYDFKSMKSRKSWSASRWGVFRGESNEQLKVDSNGFFEDSHEYKSMYFQDWYEIYPVQSFAYLEDQNHRLSVHPDRATSVSYYNSYRSMDVMITRFTTTDDELGAFDEEKDFKTSLSQSFTIQYEQIDSRRLYRHLNNFRRPLQFDVQFPFSNFENHKSALNDTENGGSSFSPSNSKREIDESGSGADVLTNENIRISLDFSLDPKRVTVTIFNQHEERYRIKDVREFIAKRYRSKYDDILDKIKRIRALDMKTNLPINPHPTDSRGIGASEFEVSVDPFTFLRLEISF